MANTSTQNDKDAKFNEFYTEVSFLFHIWANYYIQLF